MTAAEIDNTLAGFRAHQHPRVFATPEALPGLRRRLEHPLSRRIVAEVRDRAVDAPSIEAGTDFARAGGERIAASALLTLLGEGPPAREIIAATRAFAAAYRPTAESVAADYWAKRDVGNALFALALVYDWCFEATTADDRAAFAATVRALAALQTAGYPPVGGSSVIGHTSENELIVDLFAAAIAIADEDPEPLRRVVERLTDGYGPVSRIVYPAGRHHQGTSYQAVRLGAELASATLARTAGLDGIWDPRGPSLAYRWLYQRLGDGSLLDDGDVGFHYRHKAGEYWALLLTRPTLLAAAMRRDDFLQEAGLRMLEAASTWRAPDHDAVRLFLAFDPEVPASPVDRLPLVRFFDEPLSAVIARTGWGTDDTVVEFRVGGLFFGNHQHLDAGAFQIYRGGRLALDSGYYHPGAYREPHSRNYAKRTIAHNALLIRDPSGRPVWHATGDAVANDGGQVWPDGGDPNTPRDLEDPQRRHACELARLDAGGFVALVGDLAPGYGSKARSYVRTSVFHAGGEGEAPFVIVRDEVEVRDDTIETAWLLHTAREPGLRDGILTALSEGGRLVVEVVGSEPLEARLVGGDGHAFEVNSVDFPPDAADIPLAAGRWRAEWRLPAGHSGEYLAVGRIAAADGPLDTVSIERSAALTTVRVGRRAVAMPHAGTGFSHTVDLEVIPGTSALLVLGLPPGTWRTNAPTCRRAVVSSCEAGLVLRAPLPAAIRLTAESG